MTTDSCWLAWQFRDDNKAHLIDWGKSEQAEAMARLFWPCGIHVEDLQNSVLLECYQKNIRVERNITGQSLPSLNLAKLPFKNTYIVAEPRENEDFGEYVECTYFYDECIPVDKENEDE